MYSSAKLVSYFRLQILETPNSFLVYLAANCIRDGCVPFQQKNCPYCPAYP
ncbi:MAG: hypothetical protein LBP59_06530 [Planctomycetaceae bacterium]|nr:hypothetical protein [Planctomycetaceae bacterium]